MRRIERKILELWKQATARGERYFPYEYMYQLIEGGTIDEFFQIDPKRLVGDRRLQAQAADLRAWMGRLDPRQRVRRGGNPR